MRTIEVKLYQFNELSDAAKAKVLEANRYINVDWDDWHEFILDEWKEKLAEFGFNDAEINYTGFYSQGDGASFTCTSVDLPKWMKARKLAGKYRALYQAAQNDAATASVDRVTHHYYHENTITADIDTHYLDWDVEDVKRRDRIEQQATEVEALLQEDARSLSQDIYADLRSAYEAETEDEAVRDTIEANEYEFTEDGGRA